MKFELTLQALDTGEIFQHTFKITKAVQKEKFDMQICTLAYFRAEKIHHTLFRGCKFKGLHDKNGLSISVCGAIEE